MYLYLIVFIYRVYSKKCDIVPLTQIKSCYVNQPSLLDGYQIRHFVVTNGTFYSTLWSHTRNQLRPMRRTGDVPGSWVNHHHHHHHHHFSKVFLQGSLKKTSDTSHPCLFFIQDWPRAAELAYRMQQLSRVMKQSAMESQAEPQRPGPPSEEWGFGMGFGWGIGGYKFHWICGG